MMAGTRFTESHAMCVRWNANEWTEWRKSRVKSNQMNNSQTNNLYDWYLQRKETKLRSNGIGKNHRETNQNQNALMAHKWVVSLIVERNIKIKKIKRKLTGSYLWTCRNQTVSPVKMLTHLLMLLNLVKADQFEWKVLELVSLNFDNDD